MAVLGSVEGGLAECCGTAALPVAAPPPPEEKNLSYKNQVFWGFLYTL